MGDFTLDTSGAVALPEPARVGVATLPNIVWPDLDAFTQGYVEALLKSVGDLTCRIGWGQLVVRFSDLAPETRAAILKDCTAWVERYPHLRDSRFAGDDFWRSRQRGYWIAQAFRPLTATLGDDGKVYLREAQSNG